MKKLIRTLIGGIFFIGIGLLMNNYVFGGMFGGPGPSAVPSSSSGNGTYIKYARRSVCDGSGCRFVGEKDSEKPAQTASASHVQAMNAKYNEQKNVSENNSSGDKVKLFALTNINTDNPPENIELYDTMFQLVFSDVLSYEMAKVLNRKLANKMYPGGNWLYQREVERDKIFK